MCLRQASGRRLAHHPIIKTVISIDTVEAPRQAAAITWGRSVELAILPITVSQLVENRPARIAQSVIDMFLIKDA